VPVITNRSLVRETEHVKPEKLERWQRIIKEAAEQSGRGILPQLISPVPFTFAAAEGLGHDCAVLAWEEATKPGIRAAMRRCESANDIGLYIGPEGGFDGNEIEEAAFYGVIPVTLGRRILRTETAAIVAAAIVLHERGEMG
jgi:16S rRNA (uracil1498-N3)-methyltransferase